MFKTLLYAWHWLSTLENWEEGALPHLTQSLKACGEGINQTRVYCSSLRRPGPQRDLPGPAKLSTSSLCSSTRISFSRIGFVHCFTPSGRNPAWHLWELNKYLRKEKVKSIGQLDLHMPCRGNCVYLFVCYKLSLPSPCLYTDAFNSSYSSYCSVFISLFLLFFFLLLF